MPDYLPALAPGTTENQNSEMELALNGSMSDDESEAEKADQSATMTTDEAPEMEGSNEWKKEEDEEDGEPAEEMEESPSSGEGANAKCSPLPPVG